MRKSRSRGWLVLAIVAAISATSIGVAVAGETITTTGKGKPQVYEGYLSCCQVITLGSKGKNEFSTIVNSPPVSATGKYQVQFTTFGVLGPAVSGETEVLLCQAVDPASISGENVGGVAGNGATESPAKPNLTGNGVYANASGVGVLEVAKGDHVEVKCTSGTGTQGSYVAAAQLDVAKVGTLVKDVQP